MIAWGPSGPPSLTLCWLYTGHMGSGATEPVEPPYGAHAGSPRPLAAEMDGSVPLPSRTWRILVAVAAVLFWGGLGFSLYQAAGVRTDPSLPSGVPVILLALQGSAITLIFRRLIGPTSAIFWIPTLIFLVAFTVIAETRLVGLISQEASMSHLLALWGSIVVSLLMVGVCLHGRFRCTRDTAPSRPAQEVVIAATLLVVALLLRLQGPVTGAVDEIRVFGEMLSLGVSPGMRFWDVSTTASPYLLHWLLFLPSSQISKLMDLFVFEKCLSAFFASLSISFWYCAVKILCNRRVALTSAMLLTVFGWHWVNSRFLYVYPFELAAIALGTLCALLAFGRGHLFAAVGLGLLWTFAILAKKISIMTIPFSCYLFFDFLIFCPRISRARVVLVFSVVVSVFLLTYLPFLLADGDLTNHIFGAGAFFRYHQVADARNQRLQTFGLTQTQAYLYVLKDAVVQLFAHSYDTARHYFRPRRPLLDPIVACVVSLGCASSVFLFFKRRESRVALVGLVVFTLPMVLSFPADSDLPYGLSRRMIGASFFLVLLGALGADALSTAAARRIPRWVIPGIVCVASAAANLHFYRTEYLNQRSVVWINNHGLRRGALQLAARPAAKEGTTVLILHDVTYENVGAFLDLTNVSYVASQAELREAIRQVKDGKVMVIIPGRAAPPGFPVDEFIKELADLIPEHLWLPGRTDPRGEPLIFTAILDRTA